MPGLDFEPSPPSPMSFEERWKRDEQSAAIMGEVRRKSERRKMSFVFSMFGALAIGVAGLTTCNVDASQGDQPENADPHVNHILSVVAVYDSNAVEISVSASAAAEEIVIERFVETGDIAAAAGRDSLVNFYMNGRLYASEEYAGGVMIDESSYDEEGNETVLTVNGRRTENLLVN